MQLNVWRIIGGRPFLVGTIDKRTGEFAYDEAYLEQGGAAISLSLPVRKGPFSAQETACYFEGLLPEGEPLSRLAAQLQVNENRYLELLEHVGRDCIADLMIAPDDSSYAPEYEPIELEQLQAIVSTPQGVAEANGESRLSLAGTQDKIGLAHNGGHSLSSGWYRPFGGAASSHIIKLARDNSTVPYIEYLCMKAALRCGLAAAETSLLPNPACATMASKRFDRDVHTLHGGISVTRRHQEDLTQAFGMSSHSKYAELEGGSFRAIAHMLHERSSAPIDDVIQLARAALYNYLIGNCDAHLKNFSILYSPDWRSIRLAPTYDLVCTTRFAKYTRAMAMRLGDAESIDDVTAHSLELLAEDLALPVVMLQEIAAELAENFMPALSAVYHDSDMAGDDGLWYEYDSLQDDVGERLEVLAEFAAA